MANLKRSYRRQGLKERWHDKRVLDQAAKANGRVADGGMAMMEEAQAIGMVNRIRSRAGLPAMSEQLIRQELRRTDR